MRHCLNCNTAVEEDDNFCPNCGHWTTKGYNCLKNNPNIINGNVVKSQNKIAYLFVLLLISMLVIILMCTYRGQNMLKPFVWAKRAFMSSKYGYDVTVLKTDNKYFDENISSLDEANKKIAYDFDSQSWQCKNKDEVSSIERKLENDLSIPSVSFCDVPMENVENISNTINGIYGLFPNVKGYLTNISITNSKNENDFTAYFEPLYEFTNSLNTKVYKTQILLNSYYYLNNNQIKENWYVKDASSYSLFAHEFGHYILYVSLLKDKNITNTTFVTEDNINTINEIKNIINSSSYAKQIVDEAINNYNNKYSSNINAYNFALGISSYAANSENIYDEIIAEAVHDYYLHRLNASKESLEIVYLLHLKLGDISI